MDVALTQSRRRDAHKASFALQFVDGPAPAVAHSGAQAPDQLGDHVGQRALVGDAAFDALGDQFRNLAFLRVAVSRSCGHGSNGAHAAVSLEAAPLKEDRLARAFLGPRKKASHHHGAGSRRQGFGDVTRELDASVGNDRDPGFLGCARTLGHRRNHGHADAGNNPRRADGTGADPDLDGIDSQREQGFYLSAVLLQGFTIRSQFCLLIMDKKYASHNFTQPAKRVLTSTTLCVSTSPVKNFTGGELPS